MVVTPCFFFPPQSTRSRHTHPVAPTTLASLSLSLSLSPNPKTLVLLIDHHHCCHHQCFPSSMSLSPLPRYTPLLLSLPIVLNLISLIPNFNFDFRLKVLSPRVSISSPSSIVCRWSDAWIHLISFTIYVCVCTGTRKDGGEHSRILVCSLFGGHEIIIINMVNFGLLSFVWLLRKWRKWQIFVFCGSKLFGWCKSVVKWKKIVFIFNGFELFG